MTFRVGQHRDRLPQDSRAGGVDVDHRLRVQHEPADRRGRPVDQLLDLVEEEGRVGEVERGAESIDDQARRTDGVAHAGGGEVAAVGGFDAAPRSPDGTPAG